MKTVADISHIARDKRGVAWIENANVKVMEVVLDHVAYGWSADQIHEQHPHLSLAQIHSALAFYYDHQAEFDAQIERDLKALRKARAAAGESPLQRRLRALVHSA
ncbi:MAG: DUF433 domain-containing protein [Verrucomicrobiota bacterium]